MDEGESTAKKNPNREETVSIRGNSRSNSKKFEAARPKSQTRKHFASTGIIMIQDQKHSTHRQPFGVPEATVRP